MPQKNTNPIVYLAVLVGGTIGLGVLLGFLLVAPSRELAIAVMSTIPYLLLTLANPLGGLVVSVVTQPLTFHFSIIDMGNGIPNLSAYRLTVATLVIFFFLRISTGRWKLRTANIGINIAAMFFIIGYFLSFDNHSWSLSKSIQFLAEMWILPLIIYSLVSNLVDNRYKLDVILHLTLILGAFSALYIIYEQSTGHILFQVRDTDKLFYGDTGLRIVRGLYGTTTIFGNVFNLLIPIDLYFFLRARTTGKKAWYLLAFCIMLVGIFLTYKRAVWLGLVLSFLIIQWFYPKFRKFFFIILFAAVIGMVLYWDSLSTSEVVTARVIETDDWQNANGRTQRWQVGLDYWEQSPVFGSGFRSYEKGPYDQVENLYIHLLASGGLVTFIPFVLIYILILKDSIRIYRQSRKNPRLFVDQDLIAISWGACAAFLFMAYFGSGVEGQPISNLLFFTLTGGTIGSQVSLLTKSVKTSLRTKCC